MTEKGKFLKRFNEAFAKSDTAYILEQVTDNIHWNLVGNKVLEGKLAMEKKLRSMESDNPIGLELHNVITHGTTAAVNGEIRMKTESGHRTYSFCDIYRLSGFKNPKIRELTSYVMEVIE